MISIIVPTFVNEVLGLIPITIVQITYFLSFTDSNLYEHLLIQGIISMSFSAGSLFQYCIGRYAGLPLFAYLKRKQMFGRFGKDTPLTLTVKTNFWWIILLRAIPFFPAKQMSVALGVLKYNAPLFILSSLIGIWIRGMLVVIFLLLFK